MKKTLSKVLAVILSLTLFASCTALSASAQGLSTVIQVAQVISKAKSYIDLASSGSDSVKMVTGLSKTNVEYAKSIVTLGTSYIDLQQAKGTVPKDVIKLGKAVIDSKKANGDLAKAAVEALPVLPTTAISALKLKSSVGSVIPQALLSDAKLGIAAAQVAPAAIKYIPSIIKLGAAGTSAVGDNAKADFDIVKNGVKLGSTALSSGPNLSDGINAVKVGVQGVKLVKNLREEPETPEAPTSDPEIPPAAETTPAPEAASVSLAD